MLHVEPPFPLTPPPPPPPPQAAFGDVDKLGSDITKKRTAAIVDASPGAKKAVRGSTIGLWRIVPCAPNVCRVNIVQQGIGGSIPLWILNLRAKNSSRVLDRIHEKYERERPRDYLYGIH